MTIISHWSASHLRADPPPARGIREIDKAVARTGAAHDGFLAGRHASLYGDAEHPEPRKGLPVGPRVPTGRMNTGSRSHSESRLPAASHPAAIQRRQCSRVQPLRITAPRTHPATSPEDPGGRGASRSVPFPHQPTLSPGAGRDDSRLPKHRRFRKRHLRGSCELSSLPVHELNAALGAHRCWV